MSWDTPGAKVTALYKSAPPKLEYPSGSQDEAINDRFKKRMDMFLFQNFQVRAALVGERPHPFAVYARLKQYWADMGDADWEFDPTTRATSTCCPAIDARNETNEIDIDEYY